MSALQTAPEVHILSRLTLWQRLWERLLRPLPDEELDDSASPSPIDGHDAGVESLDGSAMQEVAR